MTKERKPRPDLTGRKASAFCAISPESVRRVYTSAHSMGNVHRSGNAAR